MRIVIISGAALLLLAAAFVGLAGLGDPPGESHTHGSAHSGAEAATALPAAILGQAGPPQGQAVHYFDADPATAGYLAEPQNGGTSGGVIVIHEWNGLVDRIRQAADAIAAEGFVVLAADLYSGRTGSNREENIALMREAQAKPERIIANLDAAAKFLRQRADVSGKIATIGWCFGGGVALSYAIGGENHDATAIFYGRLLEDPEQMRHIHHEIYGTFAGQDRGIPPEQVKRFVAALRQAGIPNDIHIYDDVEHGFWLYVDRDPERNTEPARDAWQRLKDYLKRTIGG
ncbi:MAG: dienelactone hydrolase family protein [Acidobacteria bacterium]|nr:dienelactone hydrolase family protein [Acidobacteriota bacterium]